MRVVTSEFPSFHSIWFPTRKTGFLYNEKVPLVGSRPFIIVGSESLEYYTIRKNSRTKSVQK